MAGPPPAAPSRKVASQIPNPCRSGWFLLANCQKLLSPSRPPLGPPSARSCGLVGRRASAGGRAQARHWMAPWCAYTRAPESLDPEPGTRQQPADAFFPCRRRNGSLLMTVFFVTEADKVAVVRRAPGSRSRRVQTSRQHTNAPPTSVSNICCNCWHGIPSRASSVCRHRELFAPPPPWTVGGRSCTSIRRLELPAHTRSWASWRSLSLESWTSSDLSQIPSETRLNQRSSCFGRACARARA